MDSSINYHEENENPIYIYLNLFFVFIGLISYLVSLFFFYLYFNFLSFIKHEIFTFIILNSLQSFLELILSPSLIKELIIYCIGCINFYLILSYINKCIQKKTIDSNNSTYELDLFYIIIIFYIICFFPFEKVFKLTIKLQFSHYVIKVILIILLFRDIYIKMQLLLENLKKQMRNSTIPDIYLYYMNENFDHKQFSIINIIFDIILALSISYYIIKILDLFLQLKIFFIYTILIIKKSVYCCLVVSGLMIFYSLNRDIFDKGGKKNKKFGEVSNIYKFNVIDVDIHQDENTKLSERKRTKERKKETKLEKDDEIDEEEEKEKVNSKVNEESETLK